MSRVDVRQGFTANLTEASSFLPKVNFCLKDACSDECWGHKGCRGVTSSRQCWCQCKLMAMEAAGRMGLPGCRGEEGFVHLLLGNDLVAVA